MVIRWGLRTVPVEKLLLACLVPLPCLPLSVTKLPFVRSRTTRDPSQTPSTKETRKPSYFAAAHLRIHVSPKPIRLLYTYRTVSEAVLNTSNNPKLRTRNSRLIFKFQYVQIRRILSRRAEMCKRNVCQSDVWLTVNRNSVWIRKTN